MNGDYGFDTGASNSDFARIKPATDYAMCQGAEVTDTDGTVLYWWLIVHLPLAYLRAA